MKAVKFPDPIKVDIWKSETPLLFGTAAKLGTWADEQWNEWASVKPASTGPWKSAFTEQINYFKIIAAACERYQQSMEADTDAGVAFVTLKNETAGVLKAIREGRILTTDTPLFTQIKTISESEPDAAVMLYISQRSDWSAQIQSAQQQGAHLFQAIIKLAGMNDSASVNPAIHASEIQTLKAQLRKDSETFNGDLAEWSERYEQFSIDANSDNSNRATAWQEELKAVRSDWQTLKKTYDEQLALQAPTQYWKDRESRSRNMSTAFGIAFLVVIAACLGVFVWVGIPYLHDVARMKDTNVLVLALPVLIPGFVAVWMLRILGRLFAENLQLVVDSGERQTMVKTFLALMHDEQRGKALVTDNDRILILHALFRPSAVSSADDAPPVHWFDILSQKLGGPRNRQNP